LWNRLTGLLLKTDLSINKKGLKKPYFWLWKDFFMIQKQTYEELEQRIQELKKEAFEPKRAEEALEESETRYRRLFESAQDGILILDADTGKIEDANPFILDMLGHDHKEMVEKKLWEIGAFKDIEKSQSAFLELQEKEYIRYENLPLETKDGRDISVEFVSNVYLVNHKKVIQCNIRDITKRKRAEEALRKSEQKFSRAKRMEAIGFMAAGIAHDLNNILSGIVSYPDLILMDLPKNSPLRKQIEIIKDSGNRAAAIVSDLLAVAKGVETGKEVLNINSIIKEYIRSSEHKKLVAINPHITFKFQLDSSLLNTKCSSSHIKKSLLNLASNSTEAIQDNGTIIISTTNRYLDKPLRVYENARQGEYTVLTVYDDGLGLSTEDLDRVFEPFYTKKILERSGTGLGLAIVWNTVRDHGGYIDVNSDEDGTTFELYFPITREEVAADSEQASWINYAGNGATILVVDDVELQREIAYGLLTKLNYSVKTVSSGEEAIEYLKTHSVDLIMLDMIMFPGMNGRETYERIIKINPNQKAIIASGFAETEDVQATQKLGAGKYIKKPFTLQTLAIAIREELKK
jgi:PAS domain S-box-containing protein